MSTAIKQAEIKKKKRVRSGIKWDRLFMACAYNWYWFVLSMIVCACLAYLYGKSQTQFYVAKTSVLIRSKDSAQGTPSMTFSDLGLSTVNTEDQILRNHLSFACRLMRLTILHYPLIQSLQHYI